MKILEPQNWLMSALLAILFFIIFVIVEVLARHTIYTLSDPQIIAHGGTTSFVFFIWCWFILSLWQEKKAVSSKTTPKKGMLYEGSIDEETCRKLGGKVIDGDVCRITSIVNGIEINKFYRIKRK